MNSDQNKAAKDTKSTDPDPNAVIVEEKIKKVTGDFQIRKYYKGRLLGKGGFAKCYEFVCAENKKNFAAKVIAKSSLVKSRAKQKLISEIKKIKSELTNLDFYGDDITKILVKKPEMSGFELSEIFFDKFNGTRYCSDYSKH